MAETSDLQYFYGLNATANKLYSRLLAQTKGNKTRRFPVAQPISSSPETPLIFPPIDLPIPNIKSSLEESGCPPLAIPILLDTFQQDAADLQKRWQTSYFESCRDFCQKNRQISNVHKYFLTFQRAIRKHYQTQLERHREHAIERAQELAEETSTSSSTARAPFNRDFVPSLEKYFAANAYPNITHRNALAKMSTMTGRQIEVWFQNRRNRAKKEGRPLKKNPNLQLNFICDTARRSSSPSILTHEAEESDADVSGDDTDDSDDSYDGIPSPQSAPPASPRISCEPPLHAFPTPYPPNNCGYNPFPSQQQGRSFITAWDRRPAAPRAAKSFKTVEVSEVEELGQQLMIKVQGRFVHKSSQKRKRRRRWDAHLRTIPEPAPLPSLISKRVYKSARPIKILDSKPASTSQIKEAFQTSETSPATLVSCCPAHTDEHSTGSWITRLTAGIQARQRTQTPSRASTPSTVSTAGSPLFSPIPSRRRPLEEDTSSSEQPSPKRRRTSPSSSSSSSSLSSTLTTPQLGPMSLPVDPKSRVPPTLDSEFDFSSLSADGLGDIHPSAPLTVSEAFHFGFQSFQPPMTANDITSDLNLYEFASQARPAACAPS